MKIINNAKCGKMKLNKVESKKKIISVFCNKTVPASGG